jgi:prepilin-type N-terminal cleavage/methylation domain-containing protein
MATQNISRKGFTLVELMVILVLFGAMMTLGVPPFLIYLRSNRLDTNTDRLATDLQLARSLSISNGSILRFTADANGYTITDPVAGTTIRQRQFDGGCNLALNATADFFPWGMADATVLNLSNCAGGRRINLLPTGMVEVEVD